MTGRAGRASPRSGRGALLAALLLSGAAAATPAAAKKPPRPALDLVVFGTPETLATEVLDDYGLNMRVTARLRITRVVSGTAPPPTVDILYIAHSTLPEGEERRFRLRPSGDGRYHVCSEGGRGYACDDPR